MRGHVCPTHRTQPIVRLNSSTTTTGTSTNYLLRPKPSQPPSHRTRIDRNVTSTRRCTRTGGTPRRPESVATTPTPLLRLWYVEPSLSQPRLVPRVRAICRPTSNKVKRRPLSVHQALQQWHVVPKQPRQQPLGGDTSIAVQPNPPPSARACTTASLPQSSRSTRRWLSFVSATCTCLTSP
jgi:hypothetical protein